MAVEGDRRGWEEDLRQAGARLEEELQRLTTYLNDEVIPDVRRNGSAALRSAATELQRLAERMEDRSGRTPPPPRPPSQGSGPK